LTVPFTLPGWSCMLSQTQEESVNEKELAPRWRQLLAALKAREMSIHQRGKDVTAREIAELEIDLKAIEARLLRASKGH
jgi:hypothetical protein